LRQSLLQRDALAFDTEDFVTERRDARLACFKPAGNGEVIGKPIGGLLAFECLELCEQLVFLFDEEIKGFACLANARCPADFEGPAGELLRYPLGALRGVEGRGDA
jgi:hypothetical protein